MYCTAWQEIFLFLTKKTLVCLTGSLKTFLFSEATIQPTSPINNSVTFSMFYAFVQDLGNQVSNKPDWELSFERDNFRGDSSEVNMFGN